MNRSVVCVWGVDERVLFVVCLFFVFVFFFFFKQKTAYEIYQCDWSSDVCSSDLQLVHLDSSTDVLNFAYCMLIVSFGLTKIALLPICLSQTPLCLPLCPYSSDVRGNR